MDAVEQVDLLVIPTVSSLTLDPRRRWLIVLSVSDNWCLNLKILNHETDLLNLVCKPNKHVQAKSPHQVHDLGGWYPRAQYQNLPT